MRQFETREMSSVRQKALTHGEWVWEEDDRTKFYELKSILNIKNINCAMTLDTSSHSFPMRHFMTGFMIEDDAFRYCFHAKDKIFTCFSLVLCMY